MMKNMDNQVFHRQPVKRGHTLQVHSSAFLAPRWSTSSSNGTGFVAGRTTFVGRSGETIGSGLAVNSRFCNSKQSSVVSIVRVNVSW